jgi:dTDP-4-amino-4,6-dideoxygalactose transaminase
VRVSRYNYKEQFGDDIATLMDDIRIIVESGKCILSDDVSDFEQRFGEYLGMDCVSGVNSGTDALVIALLALGVGPGDEVITQANTFNATVAAIRLVGAIPVLVDAQEDSFLIDHSQLEPAITARSRVLIPVHLFGKPTRMEEIKAIASRYNLAIVEDAAQAHGARIQGRMTGSHGDISCFSFHPSKNLAAAGDAGAVATNDRELNRKIRLIRALGQERQNCHVTVGLNSKLDAIQARILLYKLSRLDEWNAKRREVAAWYKECLNGLPIVFQSTSDDEEHVYHLFQIRTTRRDELLNFLLSCDIDAVIRYPQPIHLQPSFADMKWRRGQFPVSEALAQQLLCLPIRPDLTLGEVEYVSACVRKFFET